MSSLIKILTGFLDNTTYRQWMSAGNKSEHNLVPSQQPASIFCYTVKHSALSHFHRTAAFRTEHVDYSRTAAFRTEHVDYKLFFHISTCYDLFISIIQKWRTWFFGTQDEVIQHLSLTEIIDCKWINYFLLHALASGWITGNLLCSENQNTLHLKHSVCHPTLQ